MKILIIGDPHYSKSNEEETDQAEREIERVIKISKPDKIVILGDTIDTLHNISLTRATKWLLDLNSSHSVTLLIGNHDRTSNQDYMSEYHPFVALEDRMDIINQTKVDNDILYVPYVPDGRFKEAIEGINMKNIKLVFCHQFFEGCGFAARDIAPSVRTISGHIHTRMILKNGVSSEPDKLLLSSGKYDVYYPGSLLCKTFADAPDRYIAVVDSESGSITEYKINVPVRITYKIENSLYKKDELILKSASKYTRFEIVGTADEIKKINKDKKIINAKSNGAAFIIRCSHVDKVEPIPMESYETQLTTRIINHSERAHHILASILSE